MKKITLIFITFGLFALSVYLAFSQGSAGPSVTAGTETVLRPAAMAEVVYDGFQAKFAGAFATVMNGLSVMTGGQMIFAIVLLALLVEFLLLYPSVRIQLKQKKIHLYHKHLVDLYEHGRLSYGQTENEIHKLYDVNEKIHSRGALFVTAQMLVFLALFWGLNLMVKAPVLASGSWSIFNISLLHKPTHFLVPLLVSLLYFLHALVKIYCKEREDYLAPSQTFVAVIFALLGSTVIYFFAGTFALALSIYFATLITFSTIRYIVVEEHAQAWGELAQKELTTMIEAAEPHQDRFETISRKWNHFPVVRHLNFHLLEEALSMSLGLLLALNFFGVFEDGNAFGMNIGFRVPRAYADFPATTYRACTNAADNLPICSNSTEAEWRAAGATLGYWFKAEAINNLIPKLLFGSYSSDGSNTVDQLPSSCCLSYTENVTTFNFQATKSSAILNNDVAGLATLALAGQGCMEDFTRSCAELTTSSTCANSGGSVGCTWNAATTTCIGAGTVHISACGYQFSSIPHVSITSGCPAPADTIYTGDSATFTAAGGSGHYRWMVKDAGGEIVQDFAETTTDNPEISFSETGGFTVVVQDYYNPLNTSEGAEGASPASSCHVTVESSCSPNFGLYDIHDRPVVLQGNTATKRVFPNATYRFFVKNAVVPAEAGIGDFATMGLDDGDREEMLTSFNQSVSEEGRPYFDIQFAEDENYSGDDGGTLTVWDPNVPNGEAECNATLNIQHLGRGIKARTSKRLKMSIH